MLKLPKGLKKKKKGKKSKKGKDEELFTEEELEKYRREHQQQQAETGEGSIKENEEWSKFKDLTTGVDSVLKRTQGDLDRIKSTSFFQRIQPKKSEPTPPPRPQPIRPVVELTEADFRRTPEVPEATTDDDSDDEDDQDDIFDTSYVEAVERGEVKLAYVPDSDEEIQDDDIFDTSHVDAIIRGQDAKLVKGKKGLDIGIAVEVLTGRIDNVTVASVRRSKRVIPGDLLLEEGDKDHKTDTVGAVDQPSQSILDADADDIPITTPIDLSVSLHTSFIQQNKSASKEDLSLTPQNLEFESNQDLEDDEFTLLAAESLEVSAHITKLENKEINLEPVLQESWSAFDANKNGAVFAEGIVEDQIDVIDPYLDQDDPFNTSFVDAVVPSLQTHFTKTTAEELEDDDDFDPRAEEVQFKLNNRRKSSVRIHLTDPSGIRESITSDDIVDSPAVEKTDLLSNSTTDLTQLGDSPLDPVDINETDIDPFDTSIVDNIVPGKVELKLLEEELIGSSTSIYRVPSDPDFDPRAEEEPKKEERRASRPENLIVNKSVVFSVGNENNLDLETKTKSAKPVTPYYTREVSITEDISEEVEEVGVVSNTLVKTRSEEDLSQKLNLSSKRRHSEYSKPSGFLQSGLTKLSGKVLTPSLPAPPEEEIEKDIDPFDTTFAGAIAPCKTELKLLAKEFSCEEEVSEFETDLLVPADDLFLVKALSPVPPETGVSTEDIDPFDTSFAGNLNPSRAELRLLHGEFLE